MKLKDSYFFITDAAIVWLVLCGFIAIGSYHLYLTEIDQAINLIKLEEKNQLDLERRTIEYTLSSVLDDLEVLARQNELQGIFSDNDNNVRDLIAKEYLSYVEEKKAYAQIRFIDIEGDELVRVELKNGVSNIVSGDFLQNKSDRYYFKETLKLKPGQIFISSFDLNVEQGQIEIPFKPMIRFGIPVYLNSEKASGVIVINFLGQDVIDFVRQVDSSTFGSLYLLNNSGYWLYSDVPENDWAFMFAKMEGVSFKQSYPELWNKIDPFESGDVEFEGKWVSFVTIDPLSYRYNKCLSSSYIQADKCHPFSEAKKRSWKLVTMISEENISNIKTSTLNEYLAISSLLFLTMLAPSIFIGYNRLKQREYKLELLHMANHDKLTGLPNRKLFYDRLNQALKMSKRTGRQVGLLYLDLDGFKPINDTIGHNAGDIVLKVTAERLEKCTRACDTVARLGGDEFAVLLPELDGASHSQIVAQRIIESIAKSVSIDKKSCNVGASIGIAYYPEHADSLKALVACADEAMYRSKDAGKSCYTIHSS